MEQLAATNETNRLLTLILAELKTSKTNQFLAEIVAEIKTANAVSRKQLDLLENLMEIVERLQSMMRYWGKIAGIWN